MNGQDYPPHPQNPFRRAMTAPAPHPENPFRSRDALAAVVFADPASETSVIHPSQRADFEAWLQRNRVTDLDHPESRYDYRGAFLAGVAPPRPQHPLGEFGRGIMTGLAKGVTRIPDIPLAVVEKGAELYDRFRTPELDELITGKQRTLPGVSDVRATIGGMQEDAEQFFDPRGIYGDVGQFAGEMIPAGGVATLGARATAAGLGLVSPTVGRAAGAALQSTSIPRRVAATVGLNAPVDVGYGLEMTPTGENPLPNIGINLALSAGGSSVIEALRQAGIARNAQTLADLRRVGEAENVARDLGDLQVEALMRNRARRMGEAADVDRLLNEPSEMGALLRQADAELAAGQNRVAQRQAAEVAARQAVEAERPSDIGALLAEWDTRVQPRMGAALVRQAQPDTPTPIRVAEGPEPEIGAPAASGAFPAHPDNPFRVEADPTGAPAHLPRRDFDRPREPRGPRRVEQMRVYTPETIPTPEGQAQYRRLEADRVRVEEELARVRGTGQKGAAALERRLSQIKRRQRDLLDPDFEARRTAAAQERLAGLSDDALRARRDEVAARLERAAEVVAHNNERAMDPRLDKTASYAARQRARLAQGQVAQDGARLDALEAEMKRRGLDAAEDAAPEPVARPTPDVVDDEAIERAAIESEEMAGGGVTPDASLWHRFLSDESGAVRGDVATSLGGAAAGAVVGGELADEDDRAGGMIRGALLGAYAGHVAGRGMRRAGTPGVGGTRVPAALRGVYERFKQGIDFGGGQQRAANRSMQGGLRARIQRISDAISGGQMPIERLGAKAEAAGLRPTENPAYQLSYVKSADQTIHMAMKQGVLDPVTRQVVAPSYEAIFEPFGGDHRRIEEALTYAVAKRAAGRGLSGFGGDAAKLREAQQLVAAFDADPVMRDFLTRLEGFIDGLGNYAVRSGLWTPEQWAAMKASDALYIPFKRIIPDDLRVNQAPVTPGQGLVNVTPGVKSFEGSKRAVADPALALAEYAQAIIRRADRYRVGHHIFDAADRLGPEGELLITRLPKGRHADRAVRQATLNQAVAQAQATGVNVNQQTIEALDDLFTPAFDHRNPAIWRNTPDGREYATVNAPDLWRALSHLHRADDSTIRRFLDITIRPVKRLFVATTTGLAPGFSVGTNPLRDIPDALAKSQAGIRPDDIARGYAEAIGGAAGLSRLADEAERFGLGSVSVYTEPTRPVHYQRSIAPTGMRDKVLSALHEAVAAPARPFEKVGEASDLGPRLGEYLAAIRQKQHLVASGQWTPEDLRLYGATKARGVTLDFQNKPGNPVLHLAADYVPFFGPATQAPFRMWDAARRNPKRVAAVAGAVAAASVMEWALKRRSDTVLAKENDRTPGERAAHMFFPLDDEGNLTIRVPMGQEMGLIHAGVSAGLEAWSEQDPHAADVFAEAVKRAAVPPANVPVATAMIENARNKRYFGGGPVEPERMRDLPPEERRFPTTSPTWDVAARAARATGLFPNASPLQAENVARSVFSRATPAVAALGEPLAERMAGRAAEERVPTDWRANPLNPVGPLQANPVPRATAAEADYYALKERVEQGFAAARKAASEGDEAGYERHIGEYGELLAPAYRNLIKKSDEVLRRMRDAERSIQGAFRAGDLSPDEARRQLNEIQTARSEFYRYVMALVREQEAETVAGR